MFDTYETYYYCVTGDMHEKIEMFSGRCKKLPARLREYNAYKTLKGQIEDFQVVLPILQEFTKVHAATAPLCFRSSSILIYCMFFLIFTMLFDFSFSPPSPSHTYPSLSNLTFLHPPFSFLLPSSHHLLRKASSVVTGKK